MLEALAPLMLANDPWPPVGLGDDARYEEGQVGEVPAGQRQFLDLLHDDHIALDRAVLGIESDELGVDRDGLGQLPDLKLDIGAQSLSRLQNNGPLHKGPEPVRLHGELVLTRNQIRHGVGADFVGRERALDIGARVANDDVGTRNCSLAHVRYEPGNRREICLSAQDRREPRARRKQGSIA